MLEDLKNIIKADYGIIVKSIEKIGERTINYVYKFISETEKTYVLKIYEIPKEKVYSSLQVQNIVFERSGLAPQVIKNKHNLLYSKCKGHLYSIQEFIAGESNNISVKCMADDLFKLHEVLKEIKIDTIEKKIEGKSNKEILKEIENSYELINDLEISVKNKMKDLLDIRKAVLERFNNDYIPTKFQIIHADVRNSNVIYKNGKSYYIDFDFISYGDLLFELGSAAMLLTGFDVELALEFVKYYNENLVCKINDEEIFKNLLDYYVQSSFPIKILKKLDTYGAVEIINGRIKSLKFCCNMLKIGV